MPSKIIVKTNVTVSVRRFIPEKGTYGPWEIQKVHNLLTDAGRDYLHLQGYETTGLGTNGGNYIAVSANAATPADGDTTLAGEITTGGLARAQGTVSHTAGTNKTTILKIFTASAAHTAVRLGALFTASSSGTMLHEAVFATSATLAINDQLQINWTITLDD